MAKLVRTQRGVTQNETGSVVQNSCANQITALPEIKKIKIKLDSWLKCFELLVSCGGKHVKQLELL